MQHRQGLVFRHVDLVQNPEAAVFRTEVHRTRPEGHLSVFKGVHADEAGGIHIHVEGHIPAGTAEHHGQILRQHIFAGGLAAGQQQVLSAQDSGDGRLPHLFSVIAVPGLWHPALHGRGGGVLGPVGPDAIQQLPADLFLFQKFQHDDSRFLQCA